MSSLKRRSRSDAGFSLAALIFFAAAASILLAAAIPAYRMQAQRELEEELIFRGQEYVRAIQKYQRLFNTYPPSVDALLETNGMRFLRKEYKDPLTGEAMRLISINPDGTVNGSTLMNQRINDQPLFAGSTPQMLGEKKGAPAPAGPGGTRGGQAQALTAMAESMQQQLAERAQQLGRGSIQARVTRGGQVQQLTIVGGAPGSSGIIGVASDSEEASVKVYNDRQKYNEWEFVAPVQAAMVTTEDGRQIRIEGESIRITTPAIRPAK